MVLEIGIPYPTAKKWRLKDQNNNGFYLRELYKKIKKLVVRDGGGVCGKTDKMLGEMTQTPPNEISGIDSSHAR